MAEYINKQLAIEELENIRQKYEMQDDCDELVARVCKNAIEELPSADVAPVVHGHWDWDTKGFPRPFCSRCGEEPWRRSNHQSDLPRYCPNCGARMDKEENNG